MKTAKRKKSIQKLIEFSPCLLFSIDSKSEDNVWEKLQNFVVSVATLTNLTKGVQVTKEECLAWRYKKEFLCWLEHFFRRQNFILYTCYENLGRCWRKRIVREVYEIFKKQFLRRKIVFLSFVCRQILEIKVSFFEVCRSNAKGVEYNLIRYGPLTNELK